MKLRPIIFTALITLTVALTFVSPVLSMDDPGFTINRMVMSSKISDREPVNIADTFSADAEKVFCFLETKNIENDTAISFVWYFEGMEKTRVTLPLQKGIRWRTYSSKKIMNMKGNWRVELEEASGIVLNTVSFKIE